MTRPRIVFSDYDNTLTTQGLLGVSEFTLNAIRRLRASGVRFAPVSGRVHSEVGRMFRGDESCGDTGAYCNGQEVWVDGECICCKRIMREDLQRVLDVLNELGDATLGAGEGGINAVAVVTAHRRLYEARSPIFARSPHLTSLDQDSYLKTNVQVFGSRERLDQVEAILKEAVPQLDFVQPGPDIPVIDITPLGWGKGAAVGLILDAIGATPDDAWAFGDSENDLAMLAAVGTPIAVANADPAVRAAAARVIGACADEAVAHELLGIATA